MAESTTAMTTATSCKFRASLTAYLLDTGEIRVYTENRECLDCTGWLACTRQMQAAVRVERLKSQMAESKAACGGEG